MSYTNNFQNLNQSTAVCRNSTTKIYVQHNSKKVNNNDNTLNLSSNEVSPAQATSSSSSNLLNIPDNLFLTQDKIESVPPTSKLSPNGKRNASEDSAISSTPSTSSATSTSHKNINNSKDFKSISAASRKKKIMLYCNNTNNAGCGTISSNYSDNNSGEIFSTSNTPSNNTVSNTNSTATTTTNLRKNTWSKLSIKRSFPNLLTGSSHNVTNSNSDISLNRRFKSGLNSLGNNIDGGVHSSANSNDIDEHDYSFISSPIAYSPVSPSSSPITNISSTAYLQDNLNGNISQEDNYKGSILVSVRVKPDLKKSINSNNNNNSKSELKLPWYIENNNNIIGYKDYGGFKLDNIFPPNCNNNDIYNCIGAPMINRLFQGFNCTMFAYGCTGSGKTYTMTGDSVEPGLIPMAADHLFHMIEEFSKINTQGDNAEELMGYKVKVSYLELYNEKVYDLLTEEETGANNKMKNSNTPRQDLKLRDDTEYGIRVIGLSEHEVNNTGEIMEWINMGNNNRKFGSTDYNLRSSRSHCIVLIRLFQTAMNGQGTKCCTLSLCDLAGSEKANISNTNTMSNNLFMSSPFSPNGVNYDTTGTNSTNTATTNNNVNYSSPNVNGNYFTDDDSSNGCSVLNTPSLSNRRKEGSFINKSLLALSTVISKLSNNKYDNNNSDLSHIPYRDSKLTRLLQPSLSGQSIITTICTVDTWNTRATAETLSTLRFASRAKNIEMVVSKRNLIANNNSNPHTNDFVNKKQVKMINFLQEKLYERELELKDLRSNTNANNNKVSINNKYLTCFDDFTNEKDLIFNKILNELPQYEKEIITNKFLEMSMELEELRSYHNTVIDTSMAANRHTIITTDTSNINNNIPSLNSSIYDDSNSKLFSPKEHANRVYELLREQENEIIELKRLLTRKDKMIAALQTLNKTMNK
ncbi:Kip2p SCDLUD_002160 [Saccharomycodes ludwigii]|uniref:Kip2p n=1 Tax=Saccharomycodes ludwigii TaxID=36035 RepID=UPI001E8B5A93|nr:hypothetical protein SCDLUD_002160 [Saccharomycodes ludwigii]KAH3902340.1 hypothetical protein SCDLUD_002160 [Saccharomycodes ludwigii]